jgi:hypothetical protein
MLGVWAALVIILNGILWTTGVPDYNLVQAVEVGAARVEQQMLGEESEDVVRKAIQAQRDTLRFWTVIAILRDFVFAPLLLCIRPLLVGVAFSAVAAVSGRHVRFPATLAAASMWQGVWVLGLAMQVALMLLLGRSAVDTSLAIFLSQESFTASRWASLQQLDCFALVGWLGITWSGWRLRQANIIMAVIACGSLALLEMTICSMTSLVVNLGMRMAIMPQ